MVTLITMMGAVSELVGLKTGLEGVKKERESKRYYLGSTQLLKEVDTIIPSFHRQGTDNFTAGKRRANWFSLWQTHLWTLIHHSLRLS